MPSPHGSESRSSTPQAGMPLPDMGIELLTLPSMLQGVLQAITSRYAINILTLPHDTMPPLQWESGDAIEVSLSYKRSNPQQKQTMEQIQ
jgi:hypothetical protein